ncbi:MAG: CoA transferase, partial [Chloroflexi bacterium]|nr:CoA transferase [Chloroflexota bacterium]
AGRPAALAAAGADPARLRAAHPRAVVAAITPFGLTGPRRDDRAGDLVAFHASGLARLLIGQVEDPAAEPPVRAAGEQSAFVGGLTAACAAMHALCAQQAAGGGELIDVSLQEALACIAIRDLAGPAYGQPTPPRRRVLDGNGATVTILPARDGFVAISPREEHQWQAWLGVLGDPAWGRNPRYASRAARVECWDEVHALLGAWSRERGKDDVYALAQAAHVPAFPLSTSADLLASPQLAHRRFFRELAIGAGAPVRLPGHPFGAIDDAGGSAVSAPSAARATVADGARAHGAANGGRAAPLAGIRVLDLSWVIAGPTCTRYLAAMGAEVVKIESAARPDPGRGSELHAVLGQGKLGLSLNLKSPEAVDVVKRLVAGADVVVENFATGVMERFRLGYEELRAIRPDLIFLSASGLGRGGPDADRVAYGTLLQCYTGFAGMNGYSGRPPAVGMAWADPVCALFMAFGVAAAIRRRRETGEGRRIDFSMVEALLWTMPGPLLQHQRGGGAVERAGNADAVHAPHGVYAAAGDDRWLAVAVTEDEEWRALAAALPALAPLAGLGRTARRERTAEIDAAIAAWARERDPHAAARALQSAGVPAAATCSAADLFADEHLRARGFYTDTRDPEGRAVRLPGLPWRSERGLPQPSPAPRAGEHTERVLRELLGLDAEAIERLAAPGALT